MKFLSLGAGVQSSTLALMIARGHLPPVDAAIFSDTQWEPSAVYAWLDWLETQLPFPVHRVTAGSIRQSIIESKNPAGHRFASVPWHTLEENGRKGIGRRQCTREFKLDPLRLEKRRLLGLAKHRRGWRGMCETWIGISTDEASRMRDAREVWDRNVYPLIELGMSRADCLTWMQENGYPTPPKSSCIGCPFHSNREWRAIKAVPEEWEDVLLIDSIIRKPSRGLRGQQFMHYSRIPLSEVDLQEKDDKLNLFEEECEGLCGV